MRKTERKGKRNEKREEKDRGPKKVINDQLTEKELVAVKRVEKSEKR